eukprot:TRINITY_DN3893_c0_g4_i1.p1 TRINITY_DN3893_c0_g4~~TRINITY_DN3893_c0_g4_i1.p1  ORF type:complete len:681 (+),score=214.55 TRINITY_DN3893_c0_g4_i1:88-2130(+)
MGTPAQFEKFRSQAKVELWSQLEKKKIHELKLSTDAVPVRGTFHCARAPGLNGAAVELTGEAFDRAARLGPLEYALNGRLVNYNTIEEYQAAMEPAAAKATLRGLANETWAAITSRAWVADPSLLYAFCVYSFADLKLHKFWYRAAMPTLSPAAPVQALAPPQPIDNVLGAAARQSLHKALDAHRGVGADAVADERGVWSHCPVFAVRVEGDTAAVVPFDTVSRADAGAVSEGRLVFCVADPCGAVGHVGSGARNLLLALAVTFGFKEKVSVVSLREGAKHGIAHSLVQTYNVPLADGIAGEDVTSLPVTLPECVKAFGWETAKAPVDLASTMDPNLLAEESAKLNLSLMKWRMTPNLDLEKIAGQKCLLVGSGTLGCGVARNLMKWGVYNMTFIDRGNVSYSNPVRQSLFIHDDAVQRKNKAKAAAEGCRRVYPLCKAEAVEMNIPMPGHAVTPAQAPDVQKTCEQFEALIEAHDVIFLLTDSRESRWLPTLLGAKHRKIVLNAALGFDSYLALRHGCPGTPAGRERLGCYFCTDITSPSDSLSDRTLDQQCTVTRPGVSDIASAFVVELLASILSHPEGLYAPTPSASDDHTGVLGTVPHQVRGGLHHFDQMAIKGPHYSQCVACSDVIVNAFAERGFDFLLDVFNNADTLANTSGITAMLKAVEDDVCDMMSDSDED